MTQEPLNPDPSTTVLVFSSEVTNRMGYVFPLVFHGLLGKSVAFTRDPEIFNGWDGPKLSYGSNPLGDEPHFKAHHLLFEKGVRPQELDVFPRKGTKAFFPVKGGAWEFDPFAAIFYLVTRYEEYLPFAHDVYHRFPASESIALKEGFLHKPVVNIWARELAAMIENRFRGFRFSGGKYQFVTTVDVDNAYEYLEKGLMRTLGAYARSMVTLNGKDLNLRTKTLLGLRHDAFDTFDHQLEIQHKYNLEAIYFFLVADYGHNDKNVAITSKKFQSLIKGVGDYAAVGIHPSFNSNYEKDKLKVEINRLSKVIHKDIRQSRQHFLKLTFPQTYRTLLEMGITDDYTMGYASELGFRAGICSPFNFYDLELELETNLTVHPFSVMEVTLRFYKNVDPQNAMEHIKPIIDEIKAVGGTYMSLWHNDSLSDCHQWMGWKGLYEEMVQYAQL